MDFDIKRNYDRSSSISTLNCLCDAAKRDFESALACGLSLYEKGEEKRIEYRSRVEKMNEDKRRLQVDLSQQQSLQLPLNIAEISKRVAADSKLESRTTSIAEVQARLTSSLTLQRLAKRHCQWAKAFLRGIYVRRAVNAAWKAFCNEKFRWIEDESVTLRRIESFCSDRIEEIPKDQIEYKYYKIWLEDQVKRVSRQLDALDSEQEALLEAEIRRMRRHAMHAGNQKHSTQELVFSYEMDEQFQLEWVGAELGALKCPEGSKDRVRFMEWCTVLRKKQVNIHQQIQVQLQNGLTNAYEAEETYIQRYIILSGDAAGASIEDFQSISARLADPFQPLKHIKWEAWYDVYKGQPWFSAQAEASVADCQSRAKQFEEIDKMKAKLSQSKANIVSLQRKIADISHEQDSLYSAAQKDGDDVEKIRHLQEMENRDMMNTRLVQLTDLLGKEKDSLQHEMHDYEQLAETISILKGGIEKEIQSEQEIENKRGKLMAEFQLRESFGIQRREKSAAPIQMSKKTVKKEIKLLRNEQARLRALHKELSEKRKGGDSRNRNAKLEQSISSLNDGVLEKTTSGGAAEAELDIERKSKIAGIERQLEDARKALSLFKASPTSYEASMTILRLRAEAKARLQIQQSSEFKDIDLQQEKLRKGREMAQKAAAAATEKKIILSEDGVKQNTFKDNEMMKLEEDSAALQLQREERASRMMTKQLDTTTMTLPVSTSTQKV